MHTLNKDEVHVWLADYSALTVDALLAAYGDMLSGDEQQQWPRFYFERDRCRYLMTRALVRTVLSRYAQVAPVDWKFSTNDYGRPEIALAGIPLSFNLSHTHSLVACIVSSDRKVGIDVENIRIREVSTDIADHYFAPVEANELRSLPVERQRDRFFEYWTLKESYIKARGMGLSIPLDKFSFHFSSDRHICLQVDPELCDSMSWAFWQFHVDVDYLIAVCVERKDGQVPRLITHKTVPLRSNELLAPVFTRTSR